MAKNQLAELSAKAADLQQLVDESKGREAQLRTQNKVWRLHIALAFIVHIRPDATRGAAESPVFGCAAGEATRTGRRILGVA